MLKKIFAGSIIALLVLFASLTGSRVAIADTPGDHPYYLHALSDLRFARAMLDKLTPSDMLDNQEQHAINKINDAINEIKKASIDDGKDLNDHPPVDTTLDKKGRYHKVKELLEKIKKDLNHEEDNGAAKGLKHRAIKHVDEAIRTVNLLIRRK